MGPGGRPVKRGHVYAIHFAGGPAHVLVVSSDVFNDVYKAATCVLIYPQEIRESTVADVPVTTPSTGTIALTELRTLSADRFEDDLGLVDELVMEAVEVGLRALFDL